MTLLEISVSFYDTYRNFSFIFLKLCMSKKQKQRDLQNIFNHGVIDFTFSQILKHNAIYVTKISFFKTYKIKMIINIAKTFGVKRSHRILFRIDGIVIMVHI